MHASATPANARPPSHPHQPDTTDAESVIDFNLDESLVNDYLDPSLSLTAIASRHGMSLRALLLWSGRPDIRDLLRLYADGCNERAAVLAAAASDRAVSATLRAVDAPNTETSRRAASTLLRLARPPRPSPTNPGEPAAAPAPAPEPAPGQSGEPEQPHAHTHPRLNSDSATSPSPAPAPAHTITPTHPADAHSDTEIITDVWERTPPHLAAPHPQAAAA